MDFMTVNANKNTVYRQYGGRKNVCLPVTKE